jgi:hypothetical protein
MFESKLLPFPIAHPPDDQPSANIYSRQYNTAISQFRASVLKGRLFRLWRRVVRQQQYLYELNTLKAGLHMRGSFYAGIRVVPIGSIVGSEGRSADFDMGFHPVRDGARERWVNMAMLHLARTPLPPVRLIQVGDAYFVRDGHHRISVCHAFGQVAVDAEVITWKALPPFPWQPGAAENPPLVKSPHLSA